MKAAATFAELSAKSCFSFLTGASQPEEMVQTAAQLGYSAISLCDINGFYGMVRAHETAEKNKIQLMIGCEIQIENSALILIAQDFTGYKQLCRLLSLGFENGKEPFFKREHLSEWISNKHFVLLPPRKFASPSFFKFLREICNPIQLVTQTLHPDRDRPLKKWLQELPSEIPKAWTWDPYFHIPERFEIYEALRAIKSNTPLSKILPSPNGENYLKPLSFLQKYRVPKEYIHHTIEIAEACHFSPREIKYRYPHEWLPVGKTVHPDRDQDQGRQRVVAYRPAGDPGDVLRASEGHPAIRGRGGCGRRYRYRARRQLPRAGTEHARAGARAAFPRPHRRRFLHAVGDGIPQPRQRQPVDRRDARGDRRHGQAGGRRRLHDLRQHDLRARLPLRRAGGTGPA